MPRANADFVKRLSLCRLTLFRFFYRLATDSMHAGEGARWILDKAKQAAPKIKIA